MSTETDRLAAWLTGHGRIAIALSGGLDSSVLLAFATSVLGPEQCLAITARTPYMMQAELTDASALCLRLGVMQLELELPVPPAIRDNPPLRCYLCKKALFAALLDEARRRGFDQVADGTNLDDDGDYRPGRKALAELGIASPLREAGLGKAAIRELGRRLGLDGDLVGKPAYACLLTRLEHGTTFDDDDLRRIDRAEEFLRQSGFAACRVRVHGRLARIEVPAADRARLLAIADETAAFLAALGFSHSCLDLEGYKRGGMNLANTP